MSTRPIITVTSRAATEGGANSSVGSIEFTLQLSQAAIDVVTVRWRMIDGTAVGSDLFETQSSTAGLVTFVPGQTVATLRISSRGDALDERDEFAVLELFDPIGALFAADMPVLRTGGAILDDDGPGANFALFVNSPVVIEGDSGTREAVFEIRSSRPASGGFNLGFSVLPGTAQAGTDYVAQTGTIVWVTGQEVATVRVPVVGDQLAEPTEYFFLSLTPPAGLDVAGPGLVGMATVLDTDSMFGPNVRVPHISVTRAAATESGNLNLRFVVTLSEPSLDAVTVDYRPLVRSAGEGDIFDNFTANANNKRISFAPGQTSVDIIISPDNDSADELDEHFVLELFNPVGAAFNGGVPLLRATGVVLDDDGAGSNLALFVSDPVILETGPGAREAQFEVRLSRPAETALTLAYETRDGSALAGQDYSARTGTLTFRPGQEVAFVNVPVSDDALAEDAERFFLVVTPPAGVNLGTAGLVGTASIIDNDGGGLPVVTLAGDATSGTLRFVVTLSQPSIDEVRVQYRTLFDTAKEDDVFSLSATRGTLVFAPGQTSASVFVSQQSENIDEIDEHVTLELFDPVNAVLAGGGPVVREIGIMRDDDGLGSNLALFVSNPLISEGDAGSREAVFEVRLSRPAEDVYSVSYATRDGLAVAGQDYTAVSGRLDFAPGQQSAFVRVPVTGERVPERAEDFFLQVTTPVNPGVGTAGLVGRALIPANDGPGPLISVEGVGRRGADPIHCPSVAAGNRSHCGQLSVAHSHVGVRRSVQPRRA
jgi:hypothetical protein